jgi:hypothetical protein
MLAARLLSQQRDARASGRDGSSWADRVMIFGLVAIAHGQLFYFDAGEPIPVSLAVLPEHPGVVR